MYCGIDEVLEVVGKFTWDDLRLLVGVSCPEFIRASTAASDIFTKP